MNADHRSAVADSILVVCSHRSWHAHVVNVRTNHVHVVVSGDAKPERMMNDVKAWATRKLRELGLAGSTEKLWARHGSTRYLWTEQDIIDAGTYVFDGQGVDFGGVRMRT